MSQLKKLILVGAGAGALAGASYTAFSSDRPLGNSQEANPAPGQQENPAVIEDAFVNGVSDNRVISDGASDIAVTIYRDNLAFITETREVTLPAGRSTVSFSGVSDLIIPQSAILRDFGAITLERNFDYDLLSQGSLFRKSIGEEVVLTRTDPATGAAKNVRAKIISAGNGVVVDIDGEVEVFDCSGLPEKISFDDLPQGLQAEPTLSIEVSAEEPGPQRFTISYLASGFDWQADYILTLDDARAPSSDEPMKASLAGWLTVENGSALSIRNAPTAIVAGELQRLYETRATAKPADWFAATCWPKGSTKTGTYGVGRGQFADLAAPAPVMMQSRAAFAESESVVDEVVVTGARLKSAEAKREDLGDYKLYRTPEPTTVASYQTKQVSFLNKSDIDVTRVHVFGRDPGDLRRIDPEDIGSGYSDSGYADLRYDIDNSRDGSLGQPLPEGTVRVMAPNGQDVTFFLGEGDVRDLAIDLPVEVDIAASPSVSMETTVTSGGARENGRTETTSYSYSLEHRVRNANPYAVLVEVSENKSGYLEGVKVRKASKRQLADSAYPKWQFIVPAYGEEVLSYSVAWTTDY